MQVDLHYALADAMLQCSMMLHRSIMPALILREGTFRHASAAWG
jgi:hypothetical protein